jgi:hypothetical protein
MMEPLVWVGRAFPNRLFAAIGLLLCLFADGAAAAQKGKTGGTADCASASNKNKPPCAVESPTGQVTVFWPKRGLTDKLARTFNSKIEVWIDKVKVGLVLGDVPLVVSVPNGPHKLSLKVFDDYLENIRPVRETDITVSAQNPLYFQIVDSGLAIVARELDAPTAQAVLFRPNAYPSLSVPGGNNTNTPSGPGTIYVYWPKPGLSLGFLDQYATQLAVLLDGKRVGAVKIGEYLMVQTPPGEHAVELDAGTSHGGLHKHGFIIGAGGTRYFHVENQDAVRMFEDSPEEAANYGKSLGFVVPASELNASATPAVLSSNEPKNERNSSTFQTAVAAVSGNDVKDKRNVSVSLAGAAGNNAKTPSPLGTVYLYWPKPGLGLGFLDKYAADLPVFLDGKRIGGVKIGEYLAVKAPPGEHALGVDAGLSNGRLLKKDFILGAGSTSHFHIENQDAVRVFEDSPEDGADYAKGLAQREAIVQ